MTFFQGASDVKINGGEFTVVNGDYTVVDRSQRINNVNSFNTTSTRIQGAYNNNSQQYYGHRAQRLPPPRPSRAPANADDESPQAIDSYFPPPSVNPALGMTGILPPGSTITNYDSLDISNKKVENSYNNNSRAYGVSGRFEPRNPTVGPQANTPHGQYNFRGQSTFSAASHLTAAVTADFQSRLPHVNTYTSIGASASFAPADVTYMSPKLKKAMDVMMRESAKTTASASIINPPEEYGDDNELEGSSDSGDSEEEMADPTRPNFSQFKSPAQGPIDPTSHANPNNGAMGDNTPRYSNSTPSFPGDKADGYLMGQGRASWQSPQPSQPYAANSAEATFGSAAIASTSAAVFSTINGPFTKIDNRHHVTNIASGNTSNTLIKDSYNDNSVQTFAPSDSLKPTSRRLGKKFSGTN